MSSLVEEWRDVDGFEGFYQVSNLGNVRSLDRYVSYKGIGSALLKGKKMKLSQSVSGYLYVTLQKDGKFKRFRVHRLVAQAFIPNPNNLSQVNHKDEDKTNNTVENLEWCDATYNCNYGTRNNKIICKRKKPIIGLNTQGEVVYEFDSAIDARKMGFDETHIASCCKGKRKMHKGIIWKYRVC